MTHLNKKAIAPLNLIFIIAALVICFTMFMFTLNSIQSTQANNSTIYNYTNSTITISANILPKFFLGFALVIVFALFVYIVSKFKTH